LVDTCWFVSDTLTVAVSNPQPIVLEYINELSTFSGYSSYQWYFNGNILTCGTSYIFHASMTGTYYVIVTDQYGCTGISNIIEHFSVIIDKTDPFDPCTIGISDVPEHLANIYPNPAGNFITIELPAYTKDKNAELTITTITGQVVFHLSINNQKSTIDVTGFAKGVYLVKVNNGDEVSMNRLIIE
jgi:hypothetical protein